MRPTQVVDTVFDQVAALPFIETNEGPLILLISSRDTGRWVLPKGWMKKNGADYENARREAWEEAGVAGLIAKQPLGHYTYRKRLHFFSRPTCKVKVFPLLVTKQALNWQEKASRTLAWLTPEDAAAKVAEKSLASLLLQFRPDTVDLGE